MEQNNGQEGFAHPYLYFNRAWAAQFRAELEKNERIRREWSGYLKLADQLLEQSFTDEAWADAEDSQHGRYGPPSEQVARMGTVLGLVYQVTGEKAYGDKLKSALLHYSGYRKWYGSGLLKNDPPWHSELNTSRFCHGFAVGYDCIYDLLDAGERRQIRRALVELGIRPTLRDWVLPETRIHALDSMGHNWWAVMIALAGVGVLAVMDEEPEAEGWLDEIVRIFPEYFLYKGSVLGSKSPNYDEAGAFYESVNYANYGLYEYLVFRLAYRERYGFTDFSDIPMLGKAGDFFLHTVYPASERPLTVNFGDGHILSGAVQAVKLLLAGGYGDPRLRWYLQEWNADYGFYDFIYHERIWGAEAKSPSREEKSALYSEIGWAVMRSGWEKDQTLLAVKSGFTWNHAHADAASFVLFHGGKPLLIDSGNCSYGRPEYHDYYLQSEAHNVVLFNGQGQSGEDLPRGVKEPGQVYHLVDHAGLRYVYADAAGPMAHHFSRNFRHFLWVEGVILIIDDVRAHREGTFQWLLHCEGEAAVEARDTLHIRNGGAQAIVRTLFPRELERKEKIGLADHDPDTKVTYFSFETTRPAREAKIITAVIPVDPAGPVPKVTSLEGHEMLGARIERGGKVTEIYLNLRADGRIMHRNCIGTFDGWETDAYLLAFTRSADAWEAGLSAVERCFISHGSFLRCGGHPLFSSMSRATACWTLHREDLSVSIQGQPYIRAELRPGTVPQNISAAGGAEIVSIRDGVVTVCRRSRMPARRPG
ncbi:heparinase II/III domain-containing protein [Paenibacillus hamazuiensis]|uniref:heparinase II/III domain-containing protein n=1 Tax=Paenibacillus hamazuiensis TaxID=2936508 RepID=UPI00200F90FE|nr:heparinase II/III family protein [Paenibacillus hamazuiensis]